MTKSKNTIPSLASKPDMWSDDENGTSEPIVAGVPELHQKWEAEQEHVGDWVDAASLTRLAQHDPLESAVEIVADRCFTEAENLGWHKSYDKLLRDVQNGQALEDMYPRTEEDYLGWIQAKMLLIVGEVCEAQEELRNGRDVKEIYYRDVSGAQGPTGECYSEQVFTIDGIPTLKPEGWLVEMADALIRLNDLVGTVAGQEGVMFGSIVAAKLQYNATRGVMHGGKKF